ncbi:flavin reductase (DIM6/NTAB) family NADH-FMN oxidoreductase RutF [Aminobacter niigataensis]|uniref:Flavin reductase (DIM6/NTAB) family NADH-FMN oxidoreductase RutF n=1 Tax=Aminobacter niigataensis TaxID=83265 RepID=A0ABR6KVW3_9HYPH|nr:flavin reductase family protein [Aminobacter niigataensis]MBB4648664.1 flavin reductase (DIM6/NTAB) family NADH-FMN oxidoreductase RutF [Aminobacter niigataensis]
MSLDALKSAFAQVPTSVAIVTTGSGSERYGATVGTLTALSLGPPMLMFAMKQTSSLLQRLEVGRPVGINVLAAHQHDIARRFATPGIDRFGDTRWCEEHALPRIDETLLWIAARVRDQLSLGDHILVTAIIEHTQTEDLAPLVFWRRGFSAISNDRGV